VQQQVPQRRHDGNVNREARGGGREENQVRGGRWEGGRDGRSN
jgi:hypothetical protein